MYKGKEERNVTFQSKSDYSRDGNNRIRKKWKQLEDLEGNQLGHGNGKTRSQ